jgi:hypothetical protein
MPLCLPSGLALNRIAVNNHYGFRFYGYFSAAGGGEDALRL